MAGYSAAPSTLERFNRPREPMESNHFGFKGYPDMGMDRPKLPLRQQMSADVNRDVNRYFGKDSTQESNGYRPPSPNMAPPPPAQEHLSNGPPPPIRQPSPMKEMQQRNSPPPPKHIEPTISPRYNDHQPLTERRRLMVPDAIRNRMTTPEMRKYEQEYNDAESDRLLALQRKEEAFRRKKEEQQKPKYPQERRMNRGRTDFDNEFMSPRKEDVLARQEREIRERERELRNLRAMDDFEMRRPPPDHGLDFGRAQSVVKKSVFYVSSQYDKPANVNIVGYLVKTEPQTERFHRRDRDRNMFGHTDNLRPFNYSNRSPRREPVGAFFGTGTEYTESFDQPTQNKSPRHIPRNPYKNSPVAFNPFGQSGGGAPIVGQTGQRDTRIKGSMGVLGREESNSAKRSYQVPFRNKLGEELQEQIAQNQRRRQADKMFLREPGIDLADNLREGKVGYPRRNEYGYQSEKQHLPHAVSKPGPQRRRDEMMQLKNILDAQTEDRLLNERIGKQHEKSLDQLHYKTINSLYNADDYGGGNKKGENLRKNKLDVIIHNPQETSPYYNKVLVEEDNQFHDPDGYFDHFKPRITVNSTHKNLYEFPDGHLKMNYRGNAPYAEHGSY